jgi:hypothetical protein
LPSVFLWHSAKKLLCREPFIRRSAKPSLPSAEALPSIFYLALGKAFFAERPKKRSAKPPALGKEADSGSDEQGKTIILLSQILHKWKKGTHNTVSCWRTDFALVPSW